MLLFLKNTSGKGHFNGTLFINVIDIKSIQNSSLRCSSLASFFSFWYKSIVSPWCFYLAFSISHTICLCIHLFVAIRFVSSVWPLKMKLLWTFIYKSLCRHRLLLLGGKYLWVEWLSLMVGLCLNCLSKGL